MADSALEVRNAVIAHMRKHEPDICRHWFDDIQVIDFKGGTLRLHVPERVRLTYLKRSCLDQFNNAAQAVTGRLVAVIFLDENEARDIEAQRVNRSNGVGNGYSGAHRASTPSAEDEMLISPDYTFDNFIQGPGNRLAHAASIAVADKPGDSYNPFFVHGGVGLGKTHLLQAICQTILQKSPETRIYYVSCDSFTNQFLTAVQEGEMHDFRNRFRNIDVLVIDDIHFLSKRERSQEEFFHTFNTLYQSGKQIVISSDAAPRDIPYLEDRLVSRFNSGLVAQIERPCYETRVTILKKKAELRGIKLPDDVASYIAAKVDTNVRELEGAIVKLRVMSTVNERTIDLMLAKEALGTPTNIDSGQQQPSVQMVIEIVCDYYDVKLTDLLSRRKFKSIAQPRQICMWLARKLTRYSLEEIGGYFGGRDHTTVLHAIRTIERRRQEEERLGRDVSQLESRLHSGDIH